MYSYWLIYIYIVYAGTHIWWTSAGPHWNSSLRYGLWWVMFGSSILVLDLTSVLQNSMCSASLCLPGMLSVTHFHFCCFYCYAVVCRSLALSLATTWAWGLPREGRPMTKYPDYQAGGTKLWTPIRSFATVLIVIQPLQVKIW